MELDNESLDGTWTIDDKSGMEFFIINEAIFSKLCILGEEFEPCFEGASITHFSLDDEFNQKIYNLMIEVKKLKGGYSLMENTVETVVEEVVETAAEVETPAEEVVETVPTVEEEILPEKDETVLFNLEDFQNLQDNYNTLENNYNDLQTRYSALEEERDTATNNYNELLSNYNNMKADYDALVEFKNKKDLEEKQAMIDSFAMLSDEEKKDVQDNIDKYSVEEIESKLSVICVHNKLDLSEKKEETVVETTYSLNDQDPVEDIDTPAWLSALRKTKKNEK